MSNISSIDNSISFIFINGFFSEKLSDLSLLPSEVIYQCSDGLFLQVPANCIISPIVHLIFVNTEKNKSIFYPKNNIKIGENSRMILIEDYSAQQSEYYTTDTITEINADKNAEIDYYKIQKEHSTATHTASLIVKQKQTSKLNAFFADYGSDSAHEKVIISLSEPGASCQLNGIYYLNQDNQSMNTTIEIDHSAEFCASSMVYKGVLDKKSQAVFNGKVQVKQAAQKTTAHQANHNLLLSIDSEVKTKPELEIYADDVKCTHGATVGQLNDELLFYLRSRGIEKAEALKLLTQAFVFDVFEKIKNNVVKQYIQQRVNDYAML